MNESVMGYQEGMANADKVQKDAERTKAQPMAGRMAQVEKMVGLKPMKRFAPTGLFDESGALLREGDAILKDESPMCWTIRYSQTHGFVGFSGMQSKQDGPQGRVSEANRGTEFAEQTNAEAHDAQRGGPQECAILLMLDRQPRVGRGRRRRWLKGIRKLY